MSSDMKLFEFASPPRTATSWIEEVCAVCYMHPSRRTEIHRPPEGKKDKLRITMVRHPVSWLNSYWTNIFPGKVSAKEVDIFADLPGLTFDEFIRSYLKEIPGEVGRMFTSYKADSYLRVEDLPGCWFEFAKTLRIPEVFVQKCLETPVVNASSIKKPKPKWNRSLRRAVLRAEKDMLEHFEYV